MRLRRQARACVWSLLLEFACGAAQAFAQAQPQPAQSTETALHTMAQSAGIIFTGEVVAVRRQNGNDGSTGVVEVDFAVDDAIRGLSGGIYTLREWAGLWAAGDQPFRVDQRYLMMLHAPGAAGLSSPVGGMDGAIPIRGGSPPAPGRTGEAAAQTDLRTIDLRWIATRVARPVAYRAASVARPTAMPVSARADLVATGVIAAPSTQDAPYATLLAKLRGWERDDAAAR
jgi:hypothetical protein